MDLIKKKLLRAIGTAIGQFSLIEQNDRIMVAVSGGKDSYALLYLLRELQKKSPVAFTLCAVHLDQGQPGYDGRPLENYLQQQGYEYHILREDTYRIVKEKTPTGKTYCALCSRLRRGILYRAADELKCSKIALGHHRDDAIETLLLNLFFSGRMAAMPAYLLSEDKAHRVIRPLIYCAEEDLAAFASYLQFPILPCRLCGTQEQAQRQKMKTLLNTLSVEHPQVKANLLAALSNVQPSHLLDSKLTKKEVCDLSQNPIDLAHLSQGIKKESLLPILLDDNNDESAF